ncbi:MAG: peptidylprolyl isomerase [Flavobacteriaceae bacterium]
MRISKITILSLLALLLIQCQEKKTKKSTQKKTESTQKIDVKEENTKTVETIKDQIVLDDKNAIPFFFEYAKDHPEKKVRVKTKFGNFIIELFENTPYHRANFIYLTQKKYFNGTTFHRVVPGFIIQGGNSDNYKTSRKRGEIGRYLLPNDLRKGHSHHRGILSMPSSEIENPYKLASPFEFFIVVQSPGAYHLDGNYTPFGRIIEGMEVVDQINQQPIDNREAPLHNIFMEMEIVK